MFTYRTAWWWLRMSLDNCPPALVSITCVVEIITIHPATIPAAAGGSRQSSSYRPLWVACCWNVCLLIPCREISRFTTVSQITPGVPGTLGVLRSAWGPAAQTQNPQPKGWRKAQWQRRQGQKALQEVGDVARREERNWRVRRSGAGCGELEVGGHAGRPPGWGGEAGGLQGQQAAAVHLTQRGSAERDPFGLTETFVWAGRGWENCVWQSQWRNVEPHVTPGRPYQDETNSTTEATAVTEVLAHPCSKVQMLNFKKNFN